MKRFGISFVLALLALSSSFVQAASPVPFPDDKKCTDRDRVFMKRAYELAGAAVKKGNPPFGALLVVDGKIVAEFANTTVTSHDPIQHAETGLISRFSPKLGRETFRRGTLYVSSEPCVMCTGAILNAGIWQVVYGTTASQFQLVIDPKEKKSPLTCRKIISQTNPDVKVKGPLLEKEGLAIHEAYWPAQMQKWKAGK